MNVETNQIPVSRMEWHGSTPVPNSALSTDIAGAGENGKGFTHSRGAENKTLFTNTYSNQRSTTIQPVLLNVENEIPKLVSLPDKYKDPKKTFGIN